MIGSDTIAGCVERCDRARSCGADDSASRVLPRPSVPTRRTASAAESVPAQRRLVNHALYSTYWDCVGLGMRARATTILDLPPQV